MTKIVISQRTASLKRCDRIMVLYHGELVGFDCHEELLKNCTVYKKKFMNLKIVRMVITMDKKQLKDCLHIVNLIVF